MADAVKNGLERNLWTLQQTVAMKEEQMGQGRQENETLKMQNTMLTDQCRSQSTALAASKEETLRLERALAAANEACEHLREENTTISLRNESLNNANTKQVVQISSLTERSAAQQAELEFQRSTLVAQQGELAQTKEERLHLFEETQAQQAQRGEQSDYIRKLEAQVTQQQRQAMSDEEVRKRLHNCVMELKGNIRVFCRVRPSLDESSSAAAPVFEFDDADILEQKVVLRQPSKRCNMSGQPQESKSYQFSFDRVFRPAASQQCVFVEIEQLVQSALDGHRVCIFAYGQTGSGKTFTMEGPDGAADARGMIPRSVEKIFAHSELLRAKGWHYASRASYLEIYNEQIFDLLAPKKGRALEVRQQRTGEVFVEGLSEHAVGSHRDVFPLLLAAAKNRSVGRTDCNARSSRSHSVFRLFLDGRNAETQQAVRGVLNLIDLAGSERLKKSNAAGLQLKETQNINRSLSCLGDVIAALSKQKQKKQHIPYRNSKLTYLLQNCFGGDCKTLMFVNLCPEKDRLDESLCSLRFAAKVNDCAVGVKK